MKTRTLGVEELRVDSFATADAPVPVPVPADAQGRTPQCSAIDLCPTRPC
jgi:hypothetical protein